MKIVDMPSVSFTLDKGIIKIVLPKVVTSRLPKKFTGNLFIDGIKEGDLFLKKPKKKMLGKVRKQRVEQLKKLRKLLDGMEDEL